MKDINYKTKYLNRVVFGLFRLIVTENFYGLLHIFSGDL